MKTILLINGSASKNSSNLAVLQHLATLAPEVNFIYAEELSTFPHFQTELSDQKTPDSILAFRETVKRDFEVEP